MVLAGESTPKAGERLTTLTLGQPSQERRTEASLPPRSRLTLGSDALGSDSIVVEWPWQEAAYAAKLLRLPAVRIAAELHEHWQRWVSRGTPTVELVAAFGLSPLPTPSTAAQDCAE